MVTDLPIEIDARRTPSEHIDDHERLHRMSRHAIYSYWHSSLQDAIDAAIQTRRPLIIQPGTYILTEPLRVSNASRLRLMADRAEITSEVDLPCLLDIYGTAFCHFSGLYLSCGGAIDDALYLHYNSASERVTTACLFTDTRITGNYSTGIRVGAPKDTAQCDHMRFIHTALSCTSEGGSTGMVIGSGAHGNNLQHTIWGLNASGHTCHVRVSGTNAIIDAGSLDRAEVAFEIESAWAVSIRGFRSESAARLLTGLPAGYAGRVSIQDVEFYLDALAADGRWIDYNKGGRLRLQNISLQGQEATDAPLIYVHPAAPLALRCEGLNSETAMQQAFDLSASVEATIGDYILTDDGMPTGISSGKWSGGQWV